MFLLLGFCYFILITVGAMLITDVPNTTNNLTIQSNMPLQVSKKTANSIILYESTDTKENDYEDIEIEMSPMNPIKLNSERKKMKPDSIRLNEVIALQSSSCRTMAEDITTYQLIRTPLAYHVASCFICTCVGGMYLTGTYKTFGQKIFTSTNSESVLSFIGSIAAIFNAVGRVFWGWFVCICK